MEYGLVNGKNPVAGIQESGPSVGRREKLKLKVYVETLPMTSPAT
jgi:hypothetical protein